MCFRPSNSEAKSVVVCPSCGKTTPLDSERCEKCGASLDGSDAPAIAPPQAPAIAPFAIPGRYNLPPLSVSHPELPGASSIRTNLVGSSINDGALWRFLKKGVVARKSQIDCWYSSPVTALIQDPVTKAVVGVEIERNGQKLNIAARNGVVLALGGYENDPNAAQQFLDQPKTLVTGTLYNEGDGMRMAQAAGARLWHTNAWESGGVGLVPEADRMRSLGADIAFFRAGSVVLVGGDARRYLAEDAEQRGGRVKVGGSWVVPARPDANFFVFDEAQRADMENGVAPRPFPNWSVDLSAEVESGKVARADDVPGLAAVLGLDGEALQATIDAYNAAAASGFDALGRQSQNMRAFGNGRHAGWSGANGECPGDGRFWRTHPALVRGGRMWQRDGAQCAKRREPGGMHRVRKDCRGGSGNGERRCGGAARGPDARAGLGRRFRIRRGSRRVGPFIGGGRRRWGRFGRPPLGEGRRHRRRDRRGGGPAPHRACRSGCPCVGRAEGAHGPGWHAGRGRGGRCHGHQHGLEGSRAQRAGTWRVRDSATACEARCGMALRGGGRATRAAQAAKGEA